MILIGMDLMMNSLLQRLHILPKTLENFLGTTIEEQEVKTMLNLGILRGMNQVKLTILINQKRKLVKPLVILLVNNVLVVKGMVM